MGKGAGPGGREHQMAKKALITNPGQLRKNVVRAMRKLLDKKLIDVSAQASTCSCNSWQVCDLARPDSGELVLSRMMNG